jgi:hypothetical protein
MPSISLLPLAVALSASVLTKAAIIGRTVGLQGAGDMGPAFTEDLITIT